MKRRRGLAVACGRRDFGGLVVGSMVAVLPACAARRGAEPDPFGDVAAGAVQQLSVGSVIPIAGVSACIARDERGIYAMTLTCTHDGVDMGSDGRVTASRISCAAHGSVFDATGAVVRGPANEPLQHFEVTVDAEGNLTVHGGSPRAADARLTL